jgi:hypothetical protein
MPKKVSKVLPAHCLDLNFPPLNWRQDAGFALIFHLPPLTIALRNTVAMSTLSYSPEYYQEWLQTKAAEKAAAAEKARQYALFDSLQGHHPDEAFKRVHSQREAHTYTPHRIHRTYIHSHSRTCTCTRLPETMPCNRSATDLIPSLRAALRTRIMQQNVSI